MALESSRHRKFVATMRCAIAHSPAIIKGVVNLRDIIVPVIDRCLKFNHENVTYNELTVVIILNMTQRAMGIVGDIENLMTSRDMDIIDLKAA